MAAALHTSPNKDKYPSSPDIPTSVDRDGFVNFNPRKRKQPDCNDDNMLECLEKKFEEQNRKINDTIISCVATAVNSALTIELSKITSALADINTNMEKLYADNINIKKSLSEVGTRLSEVEKSLDFASERQDSLETRTSELEGKASRTSAIPTEISNLQYKISVMEQQARQCNIEISNLPERKGENLINLVQCLSNEIKSPVQPSDIVAIHRVPHADSKNAHPKNIIVKLTSRLLRDNFISAYRTTKGVDSARLSVSGSPHKIYVNEHLTLSNKQLFRQSREAANKQNYKYVWIKHGITLARKSDTSPVIAIRTSEDIAKIK